MSEYVPIFDDWGEISNFFELVGRLPTPKEINLIDENMDIMRKINKEPCKPPTAFAILMETTAIPCKNADEIKFKKYGLEE